MDIPELEAFVASIDTGSISQAAVRLNRVQSSISMRIKRLEERFGMVLLERRAGGITPTEQGMVLYSNAKRILEIVRETKLELKQSVRSNPRFRLGVVEGVPLSCINEILAAQDAMLVCIDVSICKSTVLIEGLSSGSLNAAIMESGHRPANCESVPLFREPAVIVSPPSRPGASAKNRRYEKIFVDRRDGALGRNLELFLSTPLGAACRVVECGSYPVLFSNVTAMQGIALVPESAIADYSSRDQIEVLDMEGEYSNASLDLVYPIVGAVPCSRSVVNLIFNVFSTKAQCS